MDETFGKAHRIFLKKEIDHVFTMKEKVLVFPFYPMFPLSRAKHQVLQY